MLTQEQKKQIERDILKHKNPYDSIEDFTWEGDRVIFHGSLLIRENKTLNAPQLISIERDNSVLENATFNAPHVTEQDLLNNYFDDEQKPIFIRGDKIGWAHQVNFETKEVKYVDEEYAKKYEKLGGLKMFIQDLIDKGMVIEL